MTTTEVQGKFTLRSIPANFAHHSAIQGRCFYLLPIQLQNSLRRNWTLLHLLPQEAMAMDWELASAFDGTNIVALFDGTPRPHFLLEGAPDPEVPADLLRERGAQNPAATGGIRKCLAIAKDDRFAAQAYLGWLRSDSSFQQELQGLLKSWDRYIQRFGLPATIMTNGVSALLPRLRAQKGYSELPGFGLAWSSFYERWQLTGMVGPLLPIPVMSHWTGFGCGLSDNPYRQAVAPVSIPSVVPLPSARELRSRMEDLMPRRQGASHLKGWHQIVENPNHSRRVQLTKYARRFKVGHYWQVLVDHYGEFAHGIRGPVRDALAEFLNVPSETMREDIRRTSI